MNFRIIYTYGYLKRADIRGQVESAGKSRHGSGGGSRGRC
jgi:hypothetical protein